MLTTLLAVNAVSLVAVLAFARFNTVRLDDAGRTVSTDWTERVVPSAPTQGSLVEA